MQFNKDEEIYLQLTTGAIVTLTPDNNEWSVDALGIWFYQTELINERRLKMHPWSAIVAVSQLQPKPEKDKEYRAYPESNVRLLENKTA